MKNLYNDAIYVLDFDGVLCDSVDECMLVSYNSFNDTNIIKISDISLNFRTYFYENRYHVRPAKEYFLLCKAYNEAEGGGDSTWEDFTTSVWPFVF